VCSPVSTMTKSAATWTAAVRPGASPVTGLARYGDGDAMWPAQRYEAGLSGLRLRDLRIERDLCAPGGERRVQREQGRIVFAHLEGIKPSAPATAHVNAMSVQDGSGPYPWRRPV
jgi:hypothetical protein